MKQLAILSIVLVLCLVQGCTSNDKDKAGAEAGITTPASESAAPASGGAASLSQSSDPAANGGSKLPAAAPYSEPGSGTVSQNVNPAPFLVASQSGGSGGAASAPSSTLTSRADGTMSGPNDQPAATTGWETPRPQTTSPSGGKSATKPSRTAPK